MKVDCISDLHGHYPTFEGGDLLIIAGDLTKWDTEFEYEELIRRLAIEDYKKIVFIAGNHDGWLESGKYNYLSHDKIEYLFDQSTEFEQYTIYGSPWTPTFFDWHFMKDRGNPIKEKWDKIPMTTDILVTHGPPMGFGDYTVTKQYAGCYDLLLAVERVKPLVHVFGHIHEGYGKQEYIYNDSSTLMVNCSYVDYHYQPVNKVITLDL